MTISWIYTRLSRWHFDNDPTRDMTPRQIVTAISNLESARVPLANRVYVLNHWR
jgi:hypothetical protein